MFGCFTINGRLSKDYSIFVCLGGISTPHKNTDLKPQNLCLSEADPPMAKEIGIPLHLDPFGLPTLPIEVASKDKDTPPPPSFQ